MLAIMSLLKRLYLSSSQGQHLRRLAEEKRQNSFLGHLGTYITCMLKVKAAFRTRKIRPYRSSEPCVKRWIENLPNKEW